MSFYPDHNVSTLSSLPLGCELQHSIQNDAILIGFIIMTVRWNNGERERGLSQTEKITAASCHVSVYSIIHYNDFQV